MGGNGAKKPLGPFGLESVEEGKFVRAGYNRHGLKRAERFVLVWKAT